MNYLPSRDPDARSVSSERGFTFAEVLLSLALTTIIMGVIFSLLVKSIETTPREVELAEAQAQARHVLEQLSQDILLAGAHLPLEFPAFTPPGVNPFIAAGEDGNPDAIEIVGNLNQRDTGEEPIRVWSFDGETALLEVAPNHIKPGDLVLLYDNEPTEGTWMFGLVSSVHRGVNPALTLKTVPGAREGGITLPSFINNYNRPHPKSGFITPVAVVTYTTNPDESTIANESEQVLWRQVNWGESNQVAHVEDLQIRYMVGGTVDDLWIPDEQPPRRITPYAEESGSKSGSGGKKRGHERKRSGTQEVDSRGDEQGLEFPPIPQPDPSERLQPDALVRGVRISVTSRTHQANLQGSTLRPGQEGSEDGYLRVTYSSRVTPRNLVFRLTTRQSQGRLQLEPTRTKGAQ